MINKNKKVTDILIHTKSRKLKILKIWASFQTELKYHDHYLSEVMQDYEVKTTFLTSDKIDKEFLPFLDTKMVKAGEDEYNGSKIIRLKSINFMRKPFIVEIKKMYQELCRKDYDILHIFGVGNPITLLALIILNFCKKKLPVVINDHSNPDLKNMSLLGKIYYKINIFLFSKLSHKVNLIITPNLASSNFIHKHYAIKKEKIRIVPLGYDAKIFTYDKNEKNVKNMLVIGFAGKILPGKRLELLIDILFEMNDDTVVCEIVGMNHPETEYQQSLRKYAKNRKVNISFNPLIKNPQKLAKFYNFIDIAVFPGSISITTLEANGCGTPVVLYESIIGLEDRVEGDRGFLFSTKEEFKKHISQYKKSKQMKSIPHVQIEKQSQKYSWQELAKVYLKIYGEVIDS